MTRRRLRAALLSLAVLLAAATAATSAPPQQTEEPLTNAAVVKLVRAGFSDKAVIAVIGSRPFRFDLSADQLIRLKKSGVSERVILAMIYRDGGSDDLTSDGEFDDPFFESEPGGHKGVKEGAASGRPGAGGNAGETNIFGSSGGSKGRTRQRGGTGGIDTDTETTGSATARIIRPPTESGGAQPKLERTPTLSNQSVVDLVEAGFSDGTIIRRIEQSPVEFDLSAEKLTELRRRRVSEPVIAAMRTAMQGATEEDGRPRR